MGSGEDRTIAGWTLPETRTDATAQFDQFVTENRFTIAVVFPLVALSPCLPAPRDCCPTRSRSTPTSSCSERS